MKDTWSNPPAAPTPAAPPRPRSGAVDKRAIAGFIDIALLLVLFVLFVIFVGESTNSDEEGVSVSLDGLPFIAYFISCYAYYFLFETFTNQTPGKKLMKLKVVAIDGRLTPGKVLVRTLLRFVDGLPVCYLVGFISVVATKDRQRLGDMAAQTLVVPVDTNFVFPETNSP